MAVDEARDADDGDDDHEDLEAEEEGEAEFLLRLHFDAPEDVEGDGEDYGWGRCKCLTVVVGVCMGFIRGCLGLRMRRKGLCLLMRSVRMSRPIATPPTRRA